MTESLLPERAKSQALGVKDMMHRGTQSIETERLVLRRFSIHDADAMYRNWASDSDVTKFLTWPAHSSADVSCAVLKDWISSYARENYYNWAIVLKEHGSDPVGNIAAVHLNDDIAMVHIGYCLGKDWWHMGIMSEALNAVMDYFFDEVGVNRIESRHDPRNPHSGIPVVFKGACRKGRREDLSCQHAWLRDERHGQLSFGRTGKLLVRSCPVQLFLHDR